MTALTALSHPPSRSAQLAKTRTCCRRWINAIKRSERGPLWEVLSRACDDAEILGLNDEAFQTFVKNAKRYHRYLHDHAIPESQAFDKQTVRGYQKYVAALRKTTCVPPPRDGKPLTYKTKPQPRAAMGNEPRLKIKTQQDIVDAIRLLYLAAVDQDASGFAPLPAATPTATLKWRGEEQRDPVRIELDLDAMLAQPFVPARGRSRCEHERNLTLAHFYATILTRNAELRESIWEALQVWKIRPGAKLPLQRWPLEALLTGEVTLDEEQVLFLTLGGAVATKSDCFRSVPVVGSLAERVQQYARAWVQGQLDTVRYLRYRARKHLHSELRPASYEQRALTVLVGGRELSVRALEEDAALFNGAHGLAGPGLLKWSGQIHTLTTEEAEAFRDLLWAEAASTRYAAALAAFKGQTPIRDVFTGVLLPSRKGGVLGDKQMQLIWREMGWTAKGWTAQHLRANAAQAFEAAHLQALRPLGRIIGHKSSTTTRLNYTGETPFADVVVAELIGTQIEAGARRVDAAPTASVRPHS